MMSELEKLLKEWNEKSSNPLIRPHRTMSDAEELINALQADNKETQHALDCMTTTAGELQDMWIHLDAASKASEKLHQIAMAGKEEVIRVLNNRVEGYRLEHNRNTRDIIALEATVDRLQQIESREE